jgi:hypothetical protein
MGYNKLRSTDEDTRTGSHHVVIGRGRGFDPTVGSDALNMHLPLDEQGWLTYLIGERTMTKQLARGGWQLLITTAVVTVFAIGLMPVSVGGDKRKDAKEKDKRHKVTVSVSVSDPAGHPLTYRWRSTDGHIIDQDAPSTEWTLPAGPGIHFAYVLVSNGQGGYTERRIAVNTDSLDLQSMHRPHRRPMDLIPPPAPASSGVPFRDWLGGGIGSYRLGDDVKPFKVALPDVEVDAITLSGPIVSEHTSTSFMGDLTLQDFSPPQLVADLGIECLVEGINIFRCFGLDASLNPVPDEVIDVEANQTNRVDLVPTQRTGRDITWITGSVLLEDGSTCGTENEFFGVTSTATAELVDINGDTIPGSQVRANSWGQFSIALTQSVHTSVVVRCEGAAPASPTAAVTTIPAPSPDTSDSFDVGVVTISGVRAPDVSSMSVTSATLTGTFDEPPTGLPSDIVPLRPPKFLAMKGLDTRRSACQYYKAVGAVRGCDAEGNFRGGAVSFEDWKRTVKIDQFASPGSLQYEALFINQVDLNLTRDHHLVSYPGGATAGYVCNHPGTPQIGQDPTTALFPTQETIDETIENVAAGKNLVACVAMDYSAAPGVNEGKPFTRFLIFGPSGELLPSVNLDGLGEKFVPGTCVGCHGGNKYAGKFPEDGTGPANIETHFLPFDIRAFAFHSSKPGLTKADQEEAIFHLNQNVKNTNPNSAIRELIDGWYPPMGGFDQTEFLAPGNMNPDYYLNVIARSCRTCHVSQRDEFSIRDLTFSNQGENAGKPGALSPAILAEVVCGQTNDLVRAYSMPNSRVTFDRFWLTRGGTGNPAARPTGNPTGKITDEVDQPKLVGSRFASECTNPIPNPRFP